jgi:hypothetical protein
VVISVDAARVDNAIFLDYLTSNVALEEDEIGSTDTTMPIANNCIDHKVHCGMPGGSGHCEDEGDESDDCDAIFKSSQRPRPAMKLQRFDLATIDVNGNDGEDGDDGDAESGYEAEALQADDGSNQNVED